jgi:uncharacterized protein
MGDIRNEPSMEEILASIKRIIAEDGTTAPAPARARRGSAPLNVSPESQEAAVPQPAAKPTVDDTDNEEVLELTQSMDPAVAPQPVATEAPSDARLVSEPVANASRHALAALSAMVVKPEANGENTLDGLVREMLRPMLKEWLDARLPELVEQLVEKEIARITGRAF